MDFIFRTRGEPQRNIFLIDKTIHGFGLMLSGVFLVDSISGSAVHKSKEVIATLVFLFIETHFHVPNIVLYTDVFKISVFRGTTIFFTVI